MTKAQNSTVDPADIARFSAIADEWWDPHGKFKPLHIFNPTRLKFIREVVCEHFDRPLDGATPFTGLRLLDVGCGGGLLSEPMARLGAEVTGIDAAQKNTQVAQVHAEQQGLEVTYRHTTIEDLVASQTAPFDVILNMEVVEHVADPGLFLQSCARLLKPGGVMIMATLNRTPKSFALGIVGAEYILRWLPRGTHDWRQFLRPDELKSLLADTPLVLDSPVGVSFNPLTWKWSLSTDTSVNYMMVARNPVVETASTDDEAVEPATL